jgi:hypothetical protein
LYQPQYTSLALQNMNTLLHGTPGGPQDYTASTTGAQTGWYDPQGNFINSGQVTPGSGGGFLSLGHGLFGGGGQKVTPGDAPSPGATWHNAGDRWDVTRTRDNAAAPGLLAMIQQQNSSQRAGDIADVQTLGLSAHDAMLAANPESAALLSRLNAQATQGLDAGSSLTPEEQRAMQQASRAAFAARGMGGGNGAVSDELLRQFDLGQQLLRQRQQFAGNVLGYNSAVVGDPFMQILGRGSNAIGQAQGLGQNSGPSLFNPESPLASSIAAGNQAYAAMFADPSTISKVGAVSNLAGGFIGSVAGGMI